MDLNDDHRFLNEDVEKGMVQAIQEEIQYQAFNEPLHSASREETARKVVNEAAMIENEVMKTASVNGNKNGDTTMSEATKAAIEQAKTAVEENAKKMEGVLGRNETENNNGTFVQMDIENGGPIMDDVPAAKGFKKILKWLACTVL